ncbi:hypothetical protein GOBAR_DD30887 [Gossypium barbadense]|nr:hypothetical protein GOBAR_DD30887 [Gossypium barbadense]
MVKPNDKMPRKKVRSHRIVQGTPNSAKTNSTEQQIAIGSSNVPVTPEEPIKVQNETGGTQRVRGHTVLSDLYELDPVERVQIREEMLDREASLRRARAEASLFDGISWGMGEDAIEEAKMLKEILAINLSPRSGGITGFIAICL